jgi:hypothetical protein
MNAEWDTHALALYVKIDELLIGAPERAVTSGGGDRAPDQ